MSECVETAKPKTFCGKAWEWVKAFTLGSACVGIMAWSMNQLGQVLVNYTTATPTYRETGDGTVGCVIYRGQASCFLQGPIESLDDLSGTI